MTHLALWGAPGPQIFHAPAVIPPTVPPVVQPGPVDDRRISDTAFRRKKKRRIEQIVPAAEPLQVPQLQPSVLQLQRPPLDFRTLAELSGTSVEAFRTEVDREIAQLLADQQEQDDEEALTMILTALED